MTVVNLALSAYPVGSIYMSVNSTSPAALFGGTWEQIKGRFLIGTGANDANTSDWFGAMDASSHNIPPGELGGEAWHTLSVSEMPSHKHLLSYRTNIIQPGTAGTWYLDPGTAGTSTDSPSILETGGGASHNNMPPYLAVYMWKRVA